MARIKKHNDTAVDVGYEAQLPQEVRQRFAYRLVVIYDRNHGG